MASSTVDIKTDLDLGSKFKPGLLYKTEDGFVYIYTNEGNFVVIHDPSGRKLGAEFLEKGLVDNEEVSPFTGSVTLTEE